MQDLGDLFWFIIGGLNGIWIHSWIVKRHRKKENPYSWKCHEPDCDFSIEGSDPKLVDIFITNHKRKVHG